MRRRHFLGSAAALLALPGSSLAQAPAGPFSLPPLPYGFDALAPHIDARTMELHHDRHHAAYVANLNTALKDHGQLAALPLPRMLAMLPELPESIRAVVRNNGGGHANHRMFWEVMGPAGGAPSGELAAAIDRDLGGLGPLQEQLNGAGLRVFGSGWAFLAVDASGRLAITARPNQDTPLMEGGRVLLGNDVWEHAYYLTYQNRRADYLKAWWNVVDWSRVGARYAAAKAGELDL